LEKLNRSDIQLLFMNKLIAEIACRYDFESFYFYVTIKVKISVSFSPMLSKSNLIFISMARRGEFMDFNQSESFEISSHVIDIIVIYVLCFWFC
jgi:hypothetical protein